MSTSRLSWMTVVALAATLSTAALVGAENPGSEAKPKAARKPGDAGNQIRERARDRIQQVAQELNLTEDQKTRLKPIFKKEADKLKALRDDASLTREQRQEKVKANREEFKKELKPVLTVEQWEKWEKMRQERPQQRQPRQPRQRQGARPETAK